MPVENVGKFENELYNSLEDEKTILESIKKEGKISDDTEAKLKEIVEKIVELNK